LIKQIYTPGDLVVFDSISIGQYMIDELWEANIESVPFNGSLLLKGEYGNLRAKAYFEAQEQIEKGVIFDDDEKAIRQMSMLWYEFNHHGQKMIPDKKTLRSKKMKSPDNADCLMMWIYGLKRIPLVRKTQTEESVFWARVKAHLHKEKKWEKINMNEGRKHTL
jgi:hypothetical protein